MFDNGIISTLMNSEALERLKKSKGREIFIKENIGELVHYSIYATLTDIDDQLIGYVNVPYFTDVNTMKNQLTHTLVPISNSYMPIILWAVLCSFFLAKGITKPLLSISENIKTVGLRKKNEKIDYPHNDEIGILVSEYNRMLDELDSSAEKLATNEREQTWREMAKQIAHEIKNPLTPMKLSVQYLLKAWDEKRDDFDNFLHKVSHTLIEQIDQLSFIASEFSSLAKMSSGEKSEIDVSERLANAVALFGRTENASITFERNVEHACILANVDQIISVFNNLLKNALQSTSNGAHVDIKVIVDVVDNNVEISISDNGNGIPDEIKSKIFKPNFTTKSNGMGLGLSIVNNIIVNSNGKIWFETYQNVGTTFYICFPLYTNKESHA